MMMKIFKSFICVALVLILSAGIVFATDESGGGGMGCTSYSPPARNNISVEIVIKQGLSK